MPASGWREAGNTMTEEHRVPDPWKVRWCPPCQQHEYDTGAPRGWVLLRGDPPPGYKESEQLTCPPQNSSSPSSTKPAE
jgi:hypothetical protein